MVSTIKKKKTKIQQKQANVKENLKILVEDGEPEILRLKRGKLEKHLLKQGLGLLYEKMIGESNLLREQSITVGLDESFFEFVDLRITLVEDLMDRLSDVPEYMKIDYSVLPDEALFKLINQSNKELSTRGTEIMESATPS
jgi:hypothetical protein